MPVIVAAWRERLGECRDGQGRREVRKSKILLDEEQVGRTLARMTHEIAEQSPDLASLALVGIQRRGVELAARLAGLLESFYGVRPPTGAIDITFYRDDIDARAGQGLRAAPGPFHRPALRRQRQDHRAGGRRALHRPHHPGGHRGPLRLRPARWPCAWPCWSTAGTATCPSAPISWARTCPPAAARRWWSTWWRRTASDEVVIEE